MSTVSDDAVIADWQKMLSLPRYGGMLVALSFLIAVFSISKPFILFLSILIFVFGIFRILNEADARRIVINYDLDESAAQKYLKFTNIMKEASQCNRIWHLLSSSTHGDGKHNAGATVAVTRAPCSIKFGSNSKFTTNVETPVVDLNTQQIFFLPDKILVFDKKGVAGQKYTNTFFRSSFTDFRETNRVPSDSTLTSTTWQFPNRDGSPDKRFKNNRRVPILRYSEMLLQNSIVSTTLQFSRLECAERMASALRDLGAPSPESAATSVVAKARRTHTERLRAALIQELPAALARLNFVSMPLDKRPALSLLASVQAFDEQIRKLNPMIANTLAICTEKLIACLESPDEQADLSVSRWMVEVKDAILQLAFWKQTLSETTFDGRLNSAASEACLAADEIGATYQDVAEQLGNILEGSGNGIKVTIASEHLKNATAEIVRLNASLPHKT